MPPSVCTFTGLPAPRGMPRAGGHWGHALLSLGGQAREVLAGGRESGTRLSRCTARRPPQVPRERRSPKGLGVRRGLPADSQFVIPQNPFNERRQYDFLFRLVASVEFCAVLVFLLRNATLAVVWARRYKRTHTPRVFCGIFLTLFPRYLSVLSTGGRAFQGVGHMQSRGCCSVAGCCCSRGSGCSSGCRSVAPDGLEIVRRRAVGCLRL